MTNKTTTNPVKWKRFSRASYASFQSLHRVIAVGTLAVAMLQSVSLKAKTTEAPAGIQRPVLVADGDSLVLDLEGVEVLGSRVPLTAEQTPRMVTVLTATEIAAQAAPSVNDLLESVIGIDVRQRGEGGVQTDVSVRGGTFDQVTILLNGVNISSPHTGHLSADFPLSPQDIERIEVLEGPAARVFGTSAFTGVINIVTKRDTDEGTVMVEAGQYGYAEGNLRLAKSHAAGSLGTMTHRLSGGYARTDGATPNSDYQQTRAFYQGELQVDSTTVDLQLGYSYKPYGANTFYGAASTDQWESNERYMAALSVRTKAGLLHLAPQVFWNRWYDHYQWHKDSPAGENFHQVDTYGLALNAWFSSRWGKTSFGAEMRNEGILSTKLGKAREEDEWVKTGGADGQSDIYYKYGADRTNLSAFLEHNLILNDWTFSLGVLANRNSGLDHKWRFYPGVDIAWRPATEWKVFASWNMALRMPTFTDLYYSGKGIEGNSTLSPEKTNDVSLGARYRRHGWRAEAQVFYSHKSDMIDWVVYADEAAGLATADWIYRSGNFRLDNVGVETSVAWMPAEIWETSPLTSLSVQWAYINEDIDYYRPVVSSKYAMEYLRHKVVINTDWRLWSKLMLTLAWRWQDRVGTGNQPYGLLDGRLAWTDDRWSVFIDANNLTDHTYYDYSFIPQPGRWIKVGGTFKFSL